MLLLARASTRACSSICSHSIIVTTYSPLLVAARRSSSPLLVAATPRRCRSSLPPFVAAAPRCSHSSLPRRRRSSSPPLRVAAAPRRRCSSSPSQLPSAAGHCARRRREGGEGAGASGRMHIIWGEATAGSVTDFPAYRERGVLGGGRPSCAGPPHQVLPAAPWSAGALIIISEKCSLS